MLLSSAWCVCVPAHAGCGLGKNVSGSNALPSRPPRPPVPRCRRTNQLGSTVPSNLRKRGAAHLQQQQQQQQCGSQALRGQQPAAKQPRVVS